MKIEDCEVGKEVIFDNQRWKIKTINGINLNLKSIDKNKGKDIAYVNYKAVKPVNKFEVGDEVVYYNELFKVWGYVYNNIIKKYNYALKNDEEEVTIAIESQLSPLKKKDELEAGDKFKTKTAEGKTNRINEVLGVFKDDKYNQIKYVAKRVQGDWKGYVDIYNSDMIDEIIYD